MRSSQAFWALSAIVCVQAITDAAVVLVGRRQAALLRSLPLLVSAAAGVLLATACLDLLPEAVHASGHASGYAPSIWEILLVSLLGLFGLEAGIHAAGGSDSPRPQPATDENSEPYSEAALLPQVRPMREHEVAGAWSLLLGSSLHSAVDGLAIAAAFAAGRRTGCLAALAVGLHELPHRLGDFSLLVHMGLRSRKAAWWAIGAGGMALVGALAAFTFGQHAAAASWLLPVSAATFLYIALADLLPQLHAHPGHRGRVGVAVCLLGGAALIAAVNHFLGE